MMNHSKRIEMLRSQPWLLKPAALNAHAQLLCSELAGDIELAGMADMRKDAKLGVDEDYWGDPIAKPYDVGSVRVIPIKGTMGRGLARLDKAFGWTDVDEIAGWFRAADQDETVKAVVELIDSPGGMVAGCAELGTTIASVGKPVVAHVFTVGASAAYWAAAAAKEIVAEPTAEVGYISAYQAAFDLTALYESMGVKVDVIKGGKFKGEGYPGTAMSADYRALLQEEVNATSEQFRAWVRERRGAIPDEHMQGQGFSAQVARELGLINFIDGLPASIHRAATLAAHIESPSIQ